jgi:hypothetical protein
VALLRRRREWRALKYREVEANAGATTVLFDNVCSSDCYIPAGYGGLDWSNFIVKDASLDQDSGYFRGLVSGDFVAFNGAADPAAFLNGTPFDFVSTYLTAAWNTGLNITVEGFLGRTCSTRKRWSLTIRPQPCSPSTIKESTPCGSLRSGELVRDTSSQWTTSPWTA